MDQPTTLVLAAFEGWNDAADVASSALDHLIAEWDPDLIHSFDPEDFYDFQVNRPLVETAEDGSRRLTFSTTRIYRAEPATTGGPEVLLVRGVEPNIRWRTFCEQILATTAPFHPGRAITLGALLADNPHTRPIPVSATTEDPGLQAAWGLPGAQYEGPTGIVGVLGHSYQAAGVPTASLWSAIPHYISHPPCPKGTIALLDKLDDLLDLRIEPGELSELARAWQRGADELSAEDPEIAEYVARLEETSDAAEIPSADTIAAEFERYLRRRGS